MPFDNIADVIELEVCSNCDRVYEARESDSTREVCNDCTHA